MGLSLAWAFSRLTALNGESLTDGVGLLMSALLLTAAAVPLAGRTARALKAKDPGCIVIDEVAGQMIASAAVLFFRFPSDSAAAGGWVVSFLAFRLFDIWKPGPIRGLQRLEGGLGIVIDDALAGVLAFATTAASCFGLSLGLS